MRNRFKFGTAGLLALSLIFANVPAARAESGPFAALDGSWTGEGQIRTSGGLRERLRCRASYRSAEAGEHLRLALRCASDSYNFDLSGDVEHRGGAIFGSWSEASRRASGTISGRVNGDHIEANAKGDSFSVTLSLTTHGNRQAVTIQSLAAEVTNVSITLNK
jgi:hypothetical protein